MKKALLLGFAALFALAVFSCDSFGIPKTISNIVGYTDDGRAIVELDLNKDAEARGLHATLAKAGTDFYEVLFYDDVGGGFYRTSWREGKTAKIRLPLGDYDGTTSYGYIFAGRAEDMMLLGVGKVTDIDGGGTTTEVTTTSTYVEFTVSALETDVKNDPINSTFIPAVWNVVEIKVGDNDIPVFMLDANITTNATFDINCADTSLFNQIILQGPASFPTKPYVWMGSDGDLPIDLDTVTHIGGVVDSPLPIPIDISILTFDNINANNTKGGLCLLTYSIPVYLSDNATATGGAAKTWYLKGGLNNNILDEGYDLMGMGGAVLIGSGEVFSDSGLEIIITP